LLNDAVEVGWCVLSGDCFERCRGKEFSDESGIFVPNWRYRMEVFGLLLIEKSTMCRNLAMEACENMMLKGILSQAGQKTESFGIWSAQDAGIIICRFQHALGRKGAVKC